MGKTLLLLLLTCAASSLHQHFTMGQCDTCNATFNTIQCHSIPIYAGMPCPVCPTGRMDMDGCETGEEKDPGQEIFFGEYETNHRRDLLRDIESKFDPNNLDMKELEEFFANLETEVKANGYETVRKDLHAKLIDLGYLLATV